MTFTTHTLNSKELLIGVMPEEACAIREGYGYLQFKVTDEQRMLTERQLLNVVFTGIEPRSRSKFTDTHGDWPVKPAPPTKLPPGSWHILVTRETLTEQSASHLGLTKSEVLTFLRSEGYDPTSNWIVLTPTV